MVGREGLQKYKFFEKYAILGTKLTSCAQKFLFCQKKTRKTESLFSRYAFGLSVLSCWGSSVAFLCTRTFNSSKPKP